jgi:hypothetical protein
MVALLSPGIPAYVTDVTTQMLVSPAIFSISHLNGFLEHRKGTM